MHPCVSGAKLRPGHQAIRHNYFPIWFHNARIITLSGRSPCDPVSMVRAEPYRLRPVRCGAIFRVQYIPVLHTDEASSDPFKTICFLSLG